MSSYIRLEILLFFRAFETGVGMLVVYRLTDMLKRRLSCDRIWNSTVDILYWLLAGFLLFAACNADLHVFVFHNKIFSIFLLFCWSQLDFKLYFYGLSFKL